MRKGSKKYTYNRAAFGQFVAERRQALGWSLSELASRVYERSGLTLYPATLHHIESGNRSLPEAQRAALHATLNLPGVSERSRLLVVSSSPSTVLTDDPVLLESISTWDWEPAKDGWLRLAHQARTREQWPEWADYAGRAGKMLMMLGRYEESAAALDTVLESDPHHIGQAALAEILLNRGWLAMTWRDYTSAARYLLKSDAIYARLGMNRGQALHFLGRTYSEWGIAEEVDSYREAGRVLLGHAYEHNKLTGDPPLLGYDLLQQIATLIYDDVATARNYLARSSELLESNFYTPANIHLKRGLMAWYAGQSSAREHLELASRAFAEGRFYVKGVASSLRMLSRSFQEERAALPQAAAHALVAAIALPYAESLDLLEEVSAQVFISLCDGVVSRHAAFWREQVERALQMDAPPFALLRTLAARPNGQAQMRWALERAQAAIRNGLPDYLTTREEQVVRHCLVSADVG